MTVISEYTETKSLESLETPCLLLDRSKLRRNVKRVADHVGELGCRIRPHVKTHKSIDVHREVEAAGHTAGITVSTLREADEFFRHGVDDILYAVGIVPAKFAHAARLIAAGCKLTVILDTPEIAAHLASYAESTGTRFDVLIELDTDGHRAGVQPDGDALLEIAHEVASASHCRLQGVMTHAGESYNCRTAESLYMMACRERDLTRRAAARLINEGLPCPIVSIGSTPTAIAIDDLAGISEVRVGVYTFFDLVMAGIGVCEVEDIALSVLVSVASYQKERNRLITDGGWMAMSRDRGTADQAIDYGYGAVTDRAGNPLENLIVAEANQEHGIVERLSGEVALPFDDLPPGTLLRILPNHACATAAQFDEYIVIEGDKPVAEWPRIRGW